MEEAKSIGVKKGSLTVEAAIVLPIFLFCMLLLVFLIQCLICQDQVQWALTRTAREISIEQAVMETDFVRSPIYFSRKVNQYMESGVSISCLRSEVEGDEILLKADYEVKLPFPVLLFQKVRFCQGIRTRAFTGVESRADNMKNDCIVYITLTGKVYHCNKDCTYLKPNVSRVLLRDIEWLRNENGGKYKSCISCIGTNGNPEGAVAK